MPKIAIITGSTREGRKSLEVAQWTKEIADARGDATYEIVDTADFNLPVWDAPTSPAWGPSDDPVAQAWSNKIAEFDGFVFVVAEYNHSITGSLKNALDYLYTELNNKAAGFVGYGSAGGARAIEHLRGILSEQQVAHVRAAAGLSLFHDFENFSTFKPTPMAAKQVEGMLDQLVVWTRAMSAVREGAFAPAGANA
ncbi:MAG: NAD(P)H-dependent oxidoreductase [Propionibacteriaceae bacterium]|nr:NAD(P)H-dependent oxidoreductase [Propionibacteriaceae bacterium]